MARSLDANIYGADENSFANGIASDALNPPSAGSVFDQDARSKGNVSSGDGENPTAKAMDGIGRDKRAKTSGNHGEQD